MFRSEAKNPLRTYLRWLWPYRNRIAIVFIFALLATGLQMIEPLFMRFIIDRVLLATGLDASARLLLLQLTGFGFVTVVLLSNVVGALRDYRQRLLNAQVMESLRRALFRRLLHLPLAKLEEMKTGGVQSMLTTNVDSATGLLQKGIVSPAIAGVRLLGGVGVLLILNWRLAIIAITVIPGAMFVSFFFSRKIKPVYSSLRKESEQLDGRTAEIFSGIRTVRAFGQECLELLAYVRGRHTILRKEMFAQRRELILWTSWGILIAGVNVATLWFGSYLNIFGRASIGDIMAFQWYTLLLLNPVWVIVNAFSEVQRSLAAVERVFDVLAIERDKPDRPDAHTAPLFVRELRFDNVSFEYLADRPVVRNLSFTIRAGMVVALVGQSGVGKTTVADLVARFHDPTQGRILLNGADIRDFRLRTYRDLLAIVQQEVFLFDGSVRDNIAYKRHGATDAEIEAAARRANAHEFIVKLSDGYGTVIGECGARLSGGQRQRLAIARAILAAPQILILDEATSNLDTASEQMIHASMDELLVGKTTFIIAHRLSTIRRADLILLLDDGRIVERGTHEELLAVRGAYHGMVMRQMFWEDGDTIAAGHNS